MIHIAAALNYSSPPINSNKSLCGTTVRLGKLTFSIEREEDWWGLPPTCETCILIHWVDPEKAYKLPGRRIYF